MPGTSIQNMLLSNELTVQEHKFNNFNSRFDGFYNKRVCIEYSPDHTHLESSNFFKASKKSDMYESLKPHINTVLKTSFCYINGYHYIDITDCIKLNHELYPKQQDTVYSKFLNPFLYSFINQYLNDTIPRYVYMRVLYSRRSEKESKSLLGNHYSVGIQLICNRFGFIYDLDSSRCSTYIFNNINSEHEGPYTFTEAFWIKFPLALTYKATKIPDTPYIINLKS